jgi:hypothetical protein
MLRSPDFDKELKIRCRLYSSVDFDVLYEWKMYFFAGIELRFVGHLAFRLVNVLTELYRLPHVIGSLQQKTINP